MASYILRRVLAGIGVVLVAYAVTFLILFAMPGDPALIMLSGGGVDEGAVRQEDIDALRETLGLNDPLIVQFGTKIWAALQGDLGMSLMTGNSVSSMIAAALPKTLALGGLALVLALIIGATIAIVATYTRASWLRNLLLSLPPIGASVPAFWVGLMLLQVFSFRIPLFPAYGTDGPMTLVLPVVALAILVSATIAQVFAKSLEGVWAEAYIDTAKAKGLSRKQIHFKHAIRNAVGPTFAITGVLVGQLFSGSVVTETVFSRNGIGQLVQQAVSKQDLPLVLGIVLISAIVFVTMNLIVDLIYPLIDPRIGSPAKKR